MSRTTATIHERSWEGSTQKAERARDSFFSPPMLVWYLVFPHLKLLFTKNAAKKRLWGIFEILTIYIQLSFKVIYEVVSRQFNSDNSTPLQRNSNNSTLLESIQLQMQSPMLSPILFPNDKY